MADKLPVPTIAALGEQTIELYQSLTDVNDTAVVLVGTGFLDQCVASLLEHSMIDSSTVRSMLHYTGQIGTFSARSDLAYGLGLIAKGVYQNLRKFGEIRNRF